MGLMAPPVGRIGSSEEFNVLREIRVDVQDILGTLEEVLQLRNSAPTNTLAVPLKAKLLDTHKSMARSLQLAIQKIENLVDQGNPRFGEDVERINLACAHAADRLGELWALARSDPFPPSRAMELAEQAKNDLSSIVPVVGRVTIPERLNEHLKYVRVGRPLDFAAIFQDELPSEDDRKALLSFLAADPEAVDGIIDVEGQIVHKASRNRWRRLASWLMIAGVPVLGAVAVAGLSYVARRFSLPGADQNHLIAPAKLHLLLPVYAAVFSGALFHVLISEAKGARQPGSSISSLGDLVVWIHVHEWKILSSILGLIVVFIGLAYSLKQLNLAAALAGGYSYDSLFELIVPKLDLRMSGLETSLRDQLNPRRK